MANILKIIENKYSLIENWFLLEINHAKFKNMFHSLKNAKGTIEFGRLNLIRNRILERIDELVELRDDLYTEFKK